MIRPIPTIGYALTSSPGFIKGPRKVMDRYSRIPVRSRKMINITNIKKAQVLRKPMVLFLN